MQAKEQLKGDELKGKGQVLFPKRLPLISLHQRRSSLLIYDKKLPPRHPSLAPWIQRFDGSVYPVSAGENLKNLDTFARHCQKISFLLEKQGKEKSTGSTKRSPKGLCFIALGGGSVCDFTGFLASVFHRGVGNQLIYIPSTLLAATDAAHGGKTALNVSSYKNQIGTFFPADRVYIVPELFQSQSLWQEAEGLVEMAKMALLTNPDLWKQMQKGWPLYRKQVSLPFLPFEFLEECILEKQKIVSADFKEEKGLRTFLNYGHTLGHALEGMGLMSHGQAVFYGMCFSLQWGVRMKIMSPKEANEILSSPLFLYFGKKLAYKAKWPSPKQIEPALQRDKKKQGSQLIRFVFLKKKGQPLLKTVSIQSILQAYGAYIRNVSGA